MNSIVVLSKFGVNLDTISNTEKEKFRANKISFIFQHHLLLPDFTALENVMIPLLINKMNVIKTKQKPFLCYKELDLEKDFIAFLLNFPVVRARKSCVARALVSKSN